jgi:UDP-glucose 4-epimerase
MRRFVVVGGAGFIGGHFVEHLLGRDTTEQVTVYDNFSSGRRWHLAGVENDPRLTIVVGEVGDLEQLSGAVAGHDTVIHLASNPDIAAAVTNPVIDFDQGTVLTQNVVEAARRGGVDLVLYASGSGIYGDLGEVEAAEDHGPLLPVSTYGASKLAGEALLSSYAAMFGVNARCFRFGNVVGPRQTHGVGYDFVRRLLADPTRLRILGDGRQSKSYVYVLDVIAAVMTAAEQVREPFAVFNVATEDYLTVTEIAQLAVEVVGLPAGSTAFEYTGGDRGWKGDVPVVRLNSERIRSLGWKNERSCREALRDSLAAMLVDAKQGRFDA